MEVQLQELIDQIKKDGVAAAEAEAEAIRQAANAEAEKIIANAQARADKLMSDAKAEQARTVQSGEDAIRQAGRNLLISFRESVTRELHAIIAQEVDAMYTSDALAHLITTAVETLAGKPETEDITVILSREDLCRLESTLLAALKQRLTCGVTLKASDQFDGGFRIAANNGSVFYDYSADAVTDMLANYLNPKVTALLKEA